MTSPAPAPTCTSTQGRGAAMQRAWCSWDIPQVAARRFLCSTRRADACPPANAFAARVRSLHGRAVAAPVEMKRREINRLRGTRGKFTDEVDAFPKSLDLP